MIPDINAVFFSAAQLPSLRVQGLLLVQKALSKSVLIPVPVSKEMLSKCCCFFQPIWLAFNNPIFAQPLTQFCHLYSLIRKCTTKRSRTDLVKSTLQCSQSAVRAVTRKGEGLNHFQYYICFYVLHFVSNLETCREHAFVGEYA